MPILTPKSNTSHEVTTHPTSFDDQGALTALNNDNDESEDEESIDMSGKKGFKAISKDLCQTIRVMNPKTNRYKRTFKCLVNGCGRTFAKSCNMAVHLRKHTGDKPYNCPHCPKMFSQSGILSRHLKNVHKNQEKKVTIKVTNRDATESSEVETNVTRNTDISKGNLSPPSDQDLIMF